MKRRDFLRLIASAPLVPVAGKLPAVEGPFEIIRAPLDAEEIFRHELLYGSAVISVTWKQEGGGEIEATLLPYATV